MTRINLIDPSILTDQHLTAERVETTMALASARRSLTSKGGLKTSDYYTLGAGHVVFFHCRLGYLKRRFRELSREMRRRGMNPSSPWPDDSWALPEMFRDYQPTAADMKVILPRIRERLLKKPEWYRHCGKPISLDWVKEHYGE